MKNEKPSDGTAGGRRKSWMVVDDNEDILEALRIFLADVTDATVECFCSPVTALEAYAAAPAKYELVITDFEMPELNGAELCRRLHHIAPRLKVCLITGSECFTPLDARREGFSGLLNKPFLRTELQQMLAEIQSVGQPQPGLVAMK